MFLENIEINIRTGKVLKTCANVEHGGADINPLTFFPDKRFARKLYTCRFPHEKNTGKESQSFVNLISFCCWKKDNSFNNC